MASGTVFAQVAAKTHSGTLRLRLRATDTGAIKQARINPSNQSGPPDFLAYDLVNISSKFYSK